MISKSKKIAIIGLGLIGGSYAKALSNANYKVIGIDIDQKAVDFAFKMKWLYKGGNDVSLISEADIIIFALYPSVLVKWIEENQSNFKSGAVITDVTGVKEGILHKIKKIIRNDVEFIASHPMAGKEVSGIKYSDTSMFKVANFIIVPTDDNSNEAIETIKDLAKILDFNNVVMLNPKEHDKMIAFVSQLTHVIAISLMNTKENENLVNYTGDSFRDLTRIAKINDELWTQLFLMNKENLIDEIDLFINTMKDFKECLMEEDIEKMKNLFKISTQRRKQFDK